MGFYWAPRHGGVLGEWRHSSTHSLTSALDGGEWSASCHGCFTPNERDHCTHWIGGSVGPTKKCIRGYIQKFPDWTPGATTENGRPITRYSCIAILWVSLASFAAITLCVASQRVFVVVVYFVSDSVRKFFDIPSYSVLKWGSLLKKGPLITPRIKWEQLRMDLKKKIGFENGKWMKLAYDCFE
jgi:hypothetical protein